MSSHKGATAPETDAAAAPKFATLDSLSARKAGEIPVKAPLVLGGQETGITLHILGAQSPTVSAALNENKNRQRKLAIARAQAGKNDEPLMTAEEEERVNDKLAAVRLVGWDAPEGFEPYSPENALRMVSENAEIFAFVCRISNDASNFLKVKSDS